MFQHGRHNSSRLLAVRSIAREAQPGTSEPILTRYAFAIPRRVGKAVVRNKLRRRLREILRLLPLQEGFDLVVSVRPPATDADFNDLKRELVALLRRARILEGQAR